MTKNKRHINFIMSQRLKNIAKNISSSKIQPVSKIEKDQLYNTIFPKHISSALQSVYSIIRENPTLFTQPDINDLDRETERTLARKQGMKLIQNLNIDLEKDPYYFQGVYYATSTYSLASMIKWIIHYMLYVKTLVNFGTNKKARDCINKAKTGQNIGCFGLTEMYHGSFNRGMKTQAYYDHKTRSFRITTNQREGQKFWIGGAAEIASMSVLWAQLIIDKQSYGPHPFIVQLRDFNNHEMLPGVTLGDVGPKNGSNMIDNGWIRIEDVVIPYENLLDKIGGINEQGRYVSKIKSNDQRFGIHMSPLSSGRALFTHASLAMSVPALTIAIRYIFQRRQFSNSPGTQENLLIDYPLTKHRMMIPLAENIVQYFGSFQISRTYSDYFKELSNPGSSIVTQMHAISASLKPILTIKSLEIVTKCRQMMGGHGYSSYSRLSNIYNDLDPAGTGQGDNMMLLQQTSKVLLKFIPKGKPGQLIDLTFISPNLPKPKLTKESLNNIDNLRCFLQNILSDHYKEIVEQTAQLKKNKCNDVWNELQPYFCNSFAWAFGHYYLFEVARKKICQEGMPKPNQDFLLRCLKLWVCSFILNEKYGKMEFRKGVEETVIELCAQLVPDSLAVVDVISPPKYVVQSPFMNEKGQGMKEYLNLVMTGKKTFERVPWYEKLLKLKQQSSK